MSFVFPLIPFLLLGVTFAAPLVTYTKGSDGSNAHQFKNPCKVSVKADPGLIIRKNLYLEPRSYSFPVTAIAAAGWKIVSAKYRNSSGQDVVLQPSSNARSYWQFSAPENLTGATNNNPRIVTVHFATLRQTPSGSPDYQEDIVIYANVVPSVATLDTDSNGLGDSWEMRYFSYIGNNPGADPDGDGLTNLQEYQRGTNPQDFWNGTAPVLVKVAGDNLTSAPGSFIPSPLTVKVQNAQGTGCPNASVSFAITSSSGQLQITSGSTPVNSLTRATDSSGQVRAYLKLPNTANATTQVIASYGGRSVIFTASTGGVGVPATGSPFSPINLRGVVNSDGSQDLSWENNPDFVGPVPIWLRINDSWVQVGTAPAGATSYHIPPQ